MCHCDSLTCDLLHNIHGTIIDAMTIYSDSCIFFYQGFSLDSSLSSVDSEEECISKKQKKKKKLTKKKKKV